MTPWRIFREYRRGPIKMSWRRTVSYAWQEWRNPSIGFGLVERIASANEARRAGVIDRLYDLFREEHRATWDAYDKIRALQSRLIDAQKELTKLKRNTAGGSAGPDSVCKTEE